MRSSLRFLGRFARALLTEVPVLGAVKVVRQWAGCYDVTPDHSPILGRTPGLENLLQMSGFVGHGFMMAPAVAERMAEWMTRGSSDELFTRFGLGRFAVGRLEREEMIIG
jgi:sarcosine oxidase subunit beta